MSKSAILFDLDGTAVDSPKQKLPSEQLISEVKRLADKYYFCAATGRVWSFAKPVLDALNVTDLAIISAGTQICDPSTGKIVWQKDLEQKALDETLTVFRQYPRWKLLYNDGTEDDYFNGGVFPEKFMNIEPVYFLEQVFVPDDVAMEMYQKLTTIKGITAVMVVAQKPGCRDIHVINSQATKEHSVTELLKRLGVDRTKTIGIGDGYNDIHLFNAVHYKVAMGNAVPEIKSAADIIVKSVTEDGMAAYLRTLTL
jgi:hypothetical protein